MTNEKVIYRKFEMWSEIFKGAAILNFVFLIALFVLEGIVDFIKLIVL